MSTVRLSIVVMAFNEAPSVTGVLEEIDTALQGVAYAYEVLVVDDGSRDGTGDLAERYAAAHRHVRVLRHPVNRGIGEVYRTGFGAATGELLTFLPADGQFPAVIVRRFETLMDRHDLVLSRFEPGKRSLLARTLSLGERTLYRLMFGRLPEFRGIMMFRTALLAELGVTPGGRGWGVLMEILVRAVRANLRITSELVELRARAAGESKVTNLRSVRANLAQAFALKRSLLRASLGS
jgi:dolichol-phosphate mannosyltransferase